MMRSKAKEKKLSTISDREERNYPAFGPKKMKEIGFKDHTGSLYASFYQRNSNTSIQSASF